MARRLYGADRVNEQLKKSITYCNECAMFPDLLFYLGMANKRTETLIDIDSKLKLDYCKEKVEDYKDKRLIGVTTNLIYNEVLLSIDEFFKPPEDGKRWIDHL